MRRATTLASGGSTGWQAWLGSENMWNSVLPAASSARNVPSASLWPARTSAIGLMPPMAGTLWQAPQLVPLKAGPSPSSTVSTPVKAFRPSRNASNSRGVMPGSGSPGRSDRSWPATGAVDRATAQAAASAAKRTTQRARHQSSTTSTPCMKSWPAPHSFEHSKT